MCPVSNTLPQLKAWDKPEQIEKKELGSAVHTVLQHAPEEGLIKASKRVPERFRRFTLQIPLSKTIAPITSPALREIAFVWRWRTGKVDVLGNEGERDYGDLEPGDVPGTADVVIRGYWVAVVADYKTGKHAPDLEQLTHLALCVVRTLCPKAIKVAAGFQKLKIDRRKKSDGVDVEDDCVFLDRMDLDFHEQRLRDAVETAKVAREDIAAGRELELTVGEHCLFCPAKQVCPKSKAVTQFTQQYWRRKK